MILQLNTRRRREWSEAEREVLRLLYSDTSTAAIAQQLGRSRCTIYQQAYKLGLKKSADYHASEQSGRIAKGYYLAGAEKTWFPPGHVPANKGLRRPGWGPGRMKETQFKPGERRGVAAWNHNEVGTIRLDPEGYLRIKIREAQPGEPTGFGNAHAWPQLHRHVWVLHHGQIPNRHIIGFRDGNRQNCAVENLELLTRAELCRRNGMWNRLPRELAEAIQMNGVLKRKIRRLKANGEKQTQRPA